MKLSLRGINRLLRSPVGVGLGAVAGILTVVGVVVGQSAPPAIPLVQLSAEPLYARGFRAKPTLTLALSVEFPTVGAAYVNGSDQDDDPTYVTTKEYVGYFDPNGCYTYDDTNDHFVRAVTATSRACDGTKFSGNFMNWATTSAIDILRYGLTGGDRIGDTATKTVLQRAVLRSSFYNSTNFPSKQLSSTLAAGALPSTLRGSHTGTIYVANCLNKVFFGTERTGSCDSPGNNSNLGTVNSLPTTTQTIDGPLPSTFNSTRCAVQDATCTFTGARYVAYGVNNRYFVKAFQGSAACNNATFGNPVSGVTKACYVSNDTIPSTALTSEGFFYSRVQVCDTGDATSRPALCVQQPNGNYKPTGNLQRYSDRLRVAVFGYLKDDTLNRYGGVLRAPMKYVGPKQFDSDFKLLSGANPVREWDESTGVFVQNPESAAEGISGAVNYLNQFGRTGVFGEYKTYDPVTELYYEALRYLQGLDPTPEAVSSVSTAQKDGFPVYSTWTDPHPVVTGLDTNGADTYACIKNNIITIGDVNTHADKSLPGNTQTSSSDFTRSARVAYNEPDFVEWTRVVGAFESGGSVSYVDGKGVTRTTSNPSTVNSGNANLHTKVPGCCNNNRYYMAGAAYWANTHDIRANGLANYAAAKARPGMRVTSYMIDVNEYGQQTAESAFKQNQFYLAGKYGGFTDKSQRGNPFLAQDGTTRDDTNWARTVPTTVAADGMVAKNYFQGNNATELLTALDDIFATVVREAGSIAGAALSSTRLVTDSAIFQGRFDPSDWSGDLVRYQVTRDASSNVNISTDDDAATKYAAVRLDAFTPLSDRKIFVGKTTPTLAGAATEFKWATLDDDHKLALRTPPTLTPLDTETVGQQRLDYVRGDRSQELTGVLRRRGSRLGDIVNSGAVFSGKPALIVGDSSYDTFYANNKNRTGTVFVGANDGMLHAFNADTMDERFTYIPSFLVKNLRDYTLPGYVHRSFADSTPAVAEAKVDGNWKTVLVSGVGGGGQGVFALDVTTPSSFTASNVLWEFTDRDDPSIGNVIGQPQILRLRRSAPTAAVDYRHYAVVAGGVNNYANDGRFSGTGKPAIFILDLGKDKSSAWVEGTNYYKIELPTGDTSKANGIVNFKAVVGSSGAVDVLYAGDLQGRLWKLNFAAAGRDKWNAAGLVAFGTAATPEPLFTAKDASGVGQPITVEPEVAYGPSRSYIVTFGTGRFLEINDLATPYQQQSYYAVLDNGTDNIPGRDYLKAATTTTSGIDASPFTWGMPSSAGATGVRAGWYFNFPGASTGERQISGIALIGGYAIFGTVEPAANGCADGSGRVYFANLASGAGSYTASTVGIQGEPLIVKLGTDSTTDNTSDGRSGRTTRYQVILQGSAGVKVADWTASGSGISGGSFGENVQVQQRSWRQIFNYEEIHNK
jgi:type IV pilus assembly protein PilY1